MIYVSCLNFAFSRLKGHDTQAIAKEMKKQLEMMKVAVQFEDAEAFTKHDFEFHEVIIYAANHQYLKTFWNHLKPVMESLILLSMRHRMATDKQDFERIHRNHQVFIEAIEHYDAEKLREAFHLNFDDVGKNIESFGYGKDLEERDPIMKYMIGVDIGTTSTKSVLYDENGQFIMKHNIGYDLHTPNVDVSEENPDELFDAVLMTVKYIVRESGISKKDIKLISFSAQMHSLVAMDAQNKRLTENITWADNRSSRYADLIENEYNGFEIYQRTGTPLHPMSPLSKIFWMKHEQPAIYNQTAKFADIKTYIFYQLFDKYVIDYSMASATGMFNLEQLDWDEKALKLLGISRDQLPELVPTTHILTGMKKRFAELMDIDENTPVVVGASDGVLSNLGVNSYKKAKLQ